MTNHRHARPWLAFSLSCALAGGIAAAETSTFDYLYIEANEGTSSGGHTAIRFGDRTYHFENRDGLLVLDREDSQSFLYTYALLGNRPVHVSRVAAEEKSRARLQEHFNRRHHAQRHQLDIRAALRDDLALVRRWHRRSTSPPGSRNDFAENSTLRIPAAGYFFPPFPSDVTTEDARQSAESTVLSALRKRIVAHHGDLFLERRRAQLRGTLAELRTEDPSAWPIELPTDALDEPPFAIPYARRYRAIVAGLLALDILESTPPLQPGSYVSTSESEFQLEKSELESLRAMGVRLEAELVRLVGSPRLDWGTAFLVGSARLAALDRSLRSGHLVFLDTYPDEAQRVDRLAVARNSDRLPDMLQETGANLRTARRALVTAARLGNGPGEMEWARVEEAANRHRELSRAASTGLSFRVKRGHLVPERDARVFEPDLSPASPAELGAMVDRAANRERLYTRRLADLYRYHLITHNCVSEILDTIAAILPADAEADSPGQRSELAGISNGRDPLDFVPFISAASVNAHYRVVERHIIPSFRSAQIEAMQRRESRAMIAFRESNTLTAQSYRRGRGDSFFLFFTDRTFMLRPIFGVANLLAAAGESVYGLLRFPSDGGQTLSTGLEGAVMSLPELVFANIRKGTNDWVAPEQRRPGGFDVRPGLTAFQRVRRGDERMETIPPE